MAVLRILNGKRNLDLFWNMLLDEAARVHSAETQRRQAWFAGVKYDFFTSDAGRALLSEVTDRLKAKGEFAHIMHRCRIAWAEHHDRNNIPF